MSDQNQDMSGDPQAKASMNNAQLPLAMQAQYVKDMSLESPYVPGSVPQADLKKDVGFFMDAKKLEEESAANEEADFYEVALGVNLKALYKDKPVYLLEMLYGVRCAVPKNLPEKQRHPMLLIEVPRYAFPFVRQLVADMVQNAGHAPFYMAPVDFAQLYIQKFGGQAKPKAGNDDANAEAATA